MRDLYINASKVADAIGVSHFKTKDEIYCAKKNTNEFPDIQIDLSISDQIRQASETPSINECNSIEKTLIAEAIQKMPDVKTNRIEEFVKKTISVDRGMINESKIIEELRETKKLAIKTNNKLYYLNFEFKEANLKIGGKIDGLDKTNNKILEVKTRRHKFLGIRDYEEIQLEIYMKMLNLSKATLVERYEQEERIHEYEHNPTLYDKIVLGLQDYVEYVCQKYPQLD
uniref:Uncharacterized protein n=1 Tax=viral metagenome TaxID=1070528 RepID=A0A6C0J805_9ZZZZ